ncbi:MAG: Ig-like domain-containing protein [Bacteroidales bacterium]|nr:Ig-like domain-containing protein [Bacteroidales bacterium]
MKKFLCAILAAAVLFNACDEIQIPASLEFPEESLEYFTHGINFSATSAEGTLTVKVSFFSSLSWSANIEDAEGQPVSWLTVSPSSGQAGQTEITVTAQDNTSEQPRSAKISITCGNISQSAHVTQEGLPATPTVTVELDKTSAQMAVGQTLELIATVLPEQEAVWISSNERVATVAGEHRVAVDGTYMNVGTVTALSEGETIITAKVGSVEATCKITVGKAGDDKVEATSITLNKTELTITTGLSEQLEIIEILPENVTERNAFWESSNPEVAVVIPRDDVVDGISYKGGRVTGRDPGEAVITAYLGSAKASCKVTVVSGGGGEATIESLVIEPAPVTLAIDEEKLLTAVIQPSDAKVTVEWKCDKPEVVALGSISDTQAKVQGLAEGKATVTAHAGGKTATCEVTVTGGTTTIAVTSITLDHTQLDMTVGQKAKLVATVYPEDATNKTLNWSVRDNRIVSVDANGELTAKSAGTTTVTVISVMNPSVMASCEVTVTAGGGGSSTLNRVYIDPSSVTLALNGEQNLTLVLDPADADVTIYWESSNSSIAKVQMTSKTTAKVQGLAVGQATLTAHAGDLTATCDVTVQSSGSSVPVESVTLNKHELELSVGQQFQLVATVLPENATEKGVVWSSNVQSSKLYIDTNGMVTGLEACEATVTVRCKDNAYIYDTCKITVTGGGSSGTDEEAVDLGLPSGLKWRSMNVGASKPEDYGNYYAWAETSPKSSYSSSNYKYPSTSYSDGITIYKKYDTTPGGDGKTVLEAEDDAATANLGNGWRMPTFKEFKELRENCTWTWKTQNGVNGALVTGPNGKSIFLPAAGWYDKTTLTGKTTYGSYWTATGDGGTANAVDFANGYLDKALVPRCEGRSVRPVKD